jgi:hypothetical protein
MFNRVEYIIYYIPMTNPLKYQHLHLSDFDISKIPFPNKGDFAESCCFGENGKMYIPINNKKTCTIYECDVSSGVHGTFKALTTLRSVILGSCIRGNNLILADSLNRCVILFDVGSGAIRRFPLAASLAAFPNDVCYGDDNTVYVVSNVNYRSKNGIVHRIDLSTDKTVNTSIVMSNIYTGCGIQFVDSILYVATLMNVVCYDTRTKTSTEILTNSVDRPMYDNVSLLSEDEVCFTIFANNTEVGHRAMLNPCLRTLLLTAMSATLGVAYFNIYNIDRKMNKRRISFMKYNNRTKESTYITFDKRIEAFDNTVTCICSHNESYYVVNWKANCLVRMTPKSEQRTVYGDNCI